MKVVIMLEKYFILALPAILANGTPPIFSRLFPNFLKYPVDFGATFGGGRIFGDHKTLRGYVLGIFFGQCVFMIFYDEGLLGVPLYFGVIAGFFALFFDSIKSFFKRRVGINAGSVWFPMDQVDWIIGYLVVLNIYADVGLLINAIHIIIGVLSHMLVKGIGYILKINETYI